MMQISTEYQPERAKGSFMVLSPFYFLLDQGRLYRETTEAVGGREGAFVFSQESPKLVAKITNC